MADENKARDAIAAVSAYVDWEFQGARISDHRDFDRSAHTWIISEGDGPVLLLTVSSEFLSDTPTVAIRDMLSRWQLADTLRGAEAKFRVLVTTGGLTTTPR